MTNEEMQRTMEFIIEQQAQFAANIQLLEEERRRDTPRLTRLEESFHALVQLAEITDARLDRLESNSTAVKTNLNVFQANMIAFEANMGTLQANMTTFEKNMSTRQATFEKNMSSLQANMAALAVAQTHADERLSALIDTVREDRNGKSKGP